MSKCCLFGPPTSQSLGYDRMLLSSEALFVWLLNADWPPSQEETFNQ